jgi:hypothetical protein
VHRLLRDIAVGGVDLYMHSDSTLSRFRERSYTLCIVVLLALRMAELQRDGRQPPVDGSTLLKVLIRVDGFDDILSDVSSVHRLRR